MAVAINTNTMDPQETRTGVSSPKLLLYLGIASMCMLFAGLTSAYIVRQASGNWLLFELPNMFYYSTTVIVISSIVIHFGVLAAKNKQKAKTNLLLLTTLVLGFLFTYLQWLGWGELYTKGIVFTGSSSNASGAFMYAITGLHIVHLVAGILYLLGLCIRALVSNNFEKIYLKAELCSIYWHFLGLLWVYLFLFLLFIR